MTIDRYKFIEAIRGLAEQTPWIAAAWIGGSDATGRTDEFSDIDLQLIVPDEHVEEAFDVPVSLTDEKAISTENSPFRTIQTLVEFIATQLNENTDA